MESQLVRYSRAGDAFHYRWAARRCLRLIELNSPLRCVTIEGSKESEQAGEYAIDLAEYSETEAAGKAIAYYQLKHSTVRTARKFVFSDFRPTLEEFAKRYAASVLKPGKSCKADSVTFSLITNRPIAETIKKAVAAIRAGDKTKIRRKFEMATKLKGQDLQRFCASLSLVDSEGDYFAQKQELRGEMADYLAGAVDRNEVDGLIALVTDRALPKSEDHRRGGEIYAEDVLQRLGVTSMRQLFPAPRQLETVSHSIKREQHDTLLAHILGASAPTIIHAPGGVGKSVAARQLAESLPTGCWGLIYDCFGGGNYRNESEPRHRACDALVQMANEMAVAGLCRPLIPRVNEPSDHLFRAFLDRLNQAITALRYIQADAKLFLLIDAADNAEMAAADFGDKCFAQALLREPMPEGCRLILLCRTERIQLLRPPSSVHRYALLPFNEAETAAYLRTFFPSASDADALEFCRLSSGNPRVQANVLAAKHETVTEALNSLGPAGTTVEEQIEAQLDLAVSELKDKSPGIIANQVDSICLGLANLPPFIPLDILANAAGVDVETIKSFVSDLGRPMWISDDAVQFRDEPTETWFRKKFGAKKIQIKSYIEALEPLAVTSTYAARSLPQLLLRAGEHARLVEMALSDEFLPEANPIDARNIRVYRLQFAFKAALKLRRLADACRLAFRAGEEVAGDRRQMELLTKNVDLIPQQQTPHRVQELAYRNRLRGDWDGSENVYSAALLSSVDAFKGESRSYLRGAEKWLTIYFRERDKKKVEHEYREYEERLCDSDVVEFAWAHFNLFGPAGAAKYLLRWKPPKFVFQVTCLFIRRLIDAGLFEEIDAIARAGAKQAYLILAIADELIAVGKFPPRTALEPSLALLAKRKVKIENVNQYSPDYVGPWAVLSLCEAAAAQGISPDKILPLLQKHTNLVADRAVADDHSEYPRRTFLRGAALRAALGGLEEPAPDSFIPKKDEKQGRDYDQGNHDKQLKEVLGALLPWYFLRARILTRDPKANDVDLEQIRSRAKSALYGRYQTHDGIPYEVSAVRFEVLALKSSAALEELENFATNVIARADKKFYLKHRLPALRTAFRLSHLEPLRDRLEQSCRRSIEGFSDQGPEEQANVYIELARAVLLHSHSDAAAYFDHAVEAVSKFGDEVLERWNAVVAVAQRASNAGKADAALTFRFVQCGEMVGESVAREKYWDRDEVFRVAVNLHPPSAFTALSRWRDRDVGWFSGQLRALAMEAVKKNIVSPVCGWGFTGFSGCNASADYSALCLSREADKAKRESVLEMALRDLQLDEAKAKEFQKLEEISAEFPTIRSRVVGSIESMTTSGKKQREEAFAIPGTSENFDHIDRLFDGVAVLVSNQLGRAVEAMHSTRGPRRSEVFWEKAIQRVPLGKEAEFLETFLGIEKVGLPDVGYAIAHMRASWRGKAGAQRGWKPFLFRIGKRFSSELTNAGRLLYWEEQSGLEAIEYDEVRNGAIEGLAESLDLVDAAIFFGFVSSAGSQVTSDEALGLLDYSLARFEIHIPADFGDGRWSEWLVPPEAVSDAVTGLVWSALGSPYSSTRWEAAHCVRRWAVLKGEREIGALLNWMQRDGVGAFGCNRYPFYHLHARLYLLIALARVSIDQPKLLFPHRRFFEDVALQGLPHILIQKHAADIALRIEAASPNAYDCETIEKLRRVGVSQFPPRVASRRSALVDTPWHTRKQVDTKLKVSLEMEFDWYWFDQISGIFGVPKDQVKELAREIAALQLEVPVGDDYRQDPRLKQWNSGDYEERGTSHSHGSYPRTDTYRFYYSYHSFLCVATKLLQQMPVVTDPDGWYNGDRWADWLRRHSITRRDRKWLADRRDPKPKRRRRWIDSRTEEEWCCSIQRDDFVDVLLDVGFSPGFLCVEGHWSDYENDRIEEITVQSALVNRHASEALARSLRWALDAHSFVLPSYGDEEKEYRAPPFELVGWIQRGGGNDSRLDQFDPYAKRISYPPANIGDEFAAMLGLSADEEFREWTTRSSRAPVAVNEIWSNESFSRRDEPNWGGRRLSASLGILKRLCHESGKDLIFCVEINRNTHHSYRSRSNGDTWTPNSYKIFLLSSDGILRDAEKSHSLG